MDNINRPAPETDVEAITPSGFEADDVPTKFARKLERERDEAREDAATYYARFNELKDFGNKLADECDRILGLGLHQNTLPRFKAALEAWRKNT